MKRLVKKSDIDNMTIVKNVIQLLLENNSVKEYILKDAREYAEDEFKFNNDLDADTVLENYREALNLDMNDIIEYFIEDIIELFENETDNMSEDEIEKFAYTKDFTEIFVEELYEQFVSDIAKVIDEEKEDADEMYGNSMY